MIVSILIITVLITIITCILTIRNTKEMSLTGKNVNRADFQLITRGYGPIGAPTMSLDEQIGNTLCPVPRTPYLIPYTTYFVTHTTYAYPFCPILYYFCNNTGTFATMTLLIPSMICHHMILKYEWGSLLHY